MTREQRYYVEGYRQGAREVAEIRRTIGWARGKAEVKHWLRMWRAFRDWSGDGVHADGLVDAYLDSVGC